MHIDLHLRVYIPSSFQIVIALSYPGKVMLYIPHQLTYTYATYSTLLIMSRRKGNYRYSRGRVQRVRVHPGESFRRRRTYRARDSKRARQWALPAPSRASP